MRKLIPALVLVGAFRPFGTPDGYGERVLDVTHVTVSRLASP